MTRTHPMWVAKIRTVETYEETVYVQAPNVAAAQEKIEELDFYTSRRRNTGVRALEVDEIKKRERPSKEPCGSRKSKKELGLTGEG